MKTTSMLTLFVAAILSSSPSFAAPKKSRLDCVITVNGHKNEIAFAVQDLGSMNAELLSLGQTEDDEPILWGEGNREIGRSMNDQGGDLRVNENALMLVGDGSTFIKIVLYKNTGYTRGWASESGSDVPSWYTKDVRCIVKSMRR